MSFNSFYRIVRTACVYFKINCLASEKKKSKFKRNYIGAKRPAYEASHFEGLGVGHVLYRLFWDHYCNGLRRPLLLYCQRSLYLALLCQPSKEFTNKYLSSSQSKSLILLPNNLLHAVLVPKSFSSLSSYDGYRF